MSALWTIQEVPESRKRKPRPAEVITESKNASLMQEARLSEPEKKVVATYTPTGQLLEFEEVEEWQRDNDFLRAHYRPASHSLTKSLHSLARLHTETINIHTHLLGSLLFTYFFLLDTLSAFPTQPLIPFFASAITCLTFSSLYHTVNNHSFHTYTSCIRLDFVGIVSLIWGSFVSSLYYGFACQLDLRNAYAGMITAFGAGALYVSLKEKFKEPAYRNFRAAVFMAMGASGVLPLIHGTQIYGWFELQRVFGARWLILEGLFYITGTLIYMAQVPERWMPGRFDVWGASHQLFHTLIVMAALCHLFSLHQARDFHEAWPHAARCAGLV